MPCYDEIVKYQAFVVTPAFSRATPENQISLTKNKYGMDTPPAGN